LAVCGLTWSITTMVTGAVDGLASLFSLRLVLGLGEGATSPAATRALSNWTSLASRGVAVGITHAARRLGTGASASIVALLPVPTGPPARDPPGITCLAVVGPLDRVKVP
jgi:sugar phosphate permease